MTKTILDTNVILNRPKSLLDYEDVVIPYAVLKELDKFKNDYKIGYKAREATRIIIDKDIKCEKFFEDSNTYVDDLLIELTVDSDYKVITQDLLMYKKAEAVGGNVELYEPTGEIYTGVTERMLDQDTIDTIYEKGIAKTYLTGLYENQFINVYNSPLIVRYKNGYLYRVDRNKRLEDLDKLNERQCMALDLLYDKDIDLVVLWGKCGTGKTSSAIKSAFRMVNNGEYGQVIVSRPMIQDGSKEEKLGTLPGDKRDKFSEFVKPFEDNMKYTQYMFEYNIQPLSILKGRNIEDAIYIVDEAQDISPSKMPKLVERMGKHSKLIITGDPRQIDNNSLDEFNNGISFLCNSLKGNKKFGCVELDKNERKGASLLGDILRSKL